MATDDELEPFERLLRSAGGELPAPTWSEPSDIGRLSIEAFQAQHGIVRETQSRGSVRLSGVGVRGHQLELDDVGQVATMWQRCVSAVGAAIEGSRSAFGRISQDIVTRTQLVLDASPAPGSLVLSLTPKAPPTLEAFPDGSRSLFGDDPRPLADRASERLLVLLEQASNVTLTDQDALGDEFQALGPRVATSVKSLAEVLSRARVDVDLEWLEPERPAVRASLDTVAASWLKDFVAGRELDEEEAIIAGIVRTVSDISKWSVETDEGLEQVDASRLTPDVIRSTKVGDAVQMRVSMRLTQRPDGTVRRAITAEQLLSGDLAEDPPLS